MELRAKFKKTEVGVIPEDWLVRKFSEHFSIYAGGDVPKQSFSKIQSKSHPYPIFANALQNKGLYGFTSERRSKSDSLTITARGYLGHAEYRSQPFFPIVRLLVLEPTGGLDAKFTAYIVNDRVKFPIESTGVPQLTVPQVRKHSVALPPTESEQRAIATVLSNVDALLTAQKKLLAKKRDIKQATMQQLLTGKKRLPGFNGEWEVKQLGDVAMIYQPVTISAGDLKSDGFTVYGANGIIGKYDKFNHETWQTIVTCRGSTCGTVNRTEENSWITGNAMVMNVDENKSIDKLFFYHLLKAQDFSLCITGSGQPQIVRGPLFGFVVNLPPNLEEQIAIATILSDMDSDITALEKQLDKTSTIKQGMMQELLTGKIRLV